jgi:hypothetical protein
MWTIEEFLQAIFLVVCVNMLLILFFGFRQGGFENMTPAADVESVCADGKSVPASAAYYEYTSATGAPKANQQVIDGMSGVPGHTLACNNGANRKQWKSAYAQTGYPLATGVSKDGMTPAPGYYAGNHNASGGPPKIQSASLVGAMEGNIPIKV